MRYVYAYSLRIHHSGQTFPSEATKTDVATHIDLRHKRAPAAHASNHDRNWDDHIPSDCLGLPRLDRCLSLVKDDATFYHCLPKRDVTAGAALAHCLSRVTTILKREYPCVYKFGYTHCLSWRWNNGTYGYRMDQDKYQNMVAVFISSASIGAALMEAFMIKEHMGSLTSLVCF